MEYTILNARTPEELTRKVNILISNGYKPVGSHQVVTTNMTNRFSGSQIHGSNYEIEYTQTMIKEDKQ